MSATESKPRIPFYQNPEFFRPQTWLLLLAGILLSLGFFLPLASWSLSADRGTVELLTHAIRFVETPAANPPLSGTGWFLLVFTLVGLLLVLVALTQYENRPRQGSMAKFGALVIALLIGGRVFHAIRLHESLAEADTALAASNPFAHLGISFYVLALAWVLMIVAMMQIGRDEQRVRQMNRFW